MALQPDSITFIEPDSPLTLRLEGTAVIVYDAPEAQTITLTVRALDDLDPVVEILTLDEAHRLAYNDDSPFEGLALTDAALIGLPLPEAGEYTIRISPFNGVSGGEVEVTLTVVDELQTVITEAEDATTITVEMRPHSVYRYRLPVEQSVTITAFDAAGVLDARLTVVDENGGVTAENDDHESDDLTLNIFDARLAFIPSDDETYTLELREFLGREGVITVRIE